MRDEKTGNVTGEDVSTVLSKRDVVTPLQTGSWGDFDDTSYRHLR